MVGFCGSRSLSRSFWPLVSRVVAGFAGQPCAVGCAAGADLAVRSAAPCARVFSVAGGQFGSGRAAFARRSSALVHAVFRSRSPLFVGFVCGPCPSGVVPAPSARACFCGGGSGSWASLALAAGLGVPVVVFWCASGPPALPAGWGSWVAASGGLVGGWRLVPGAVQSSLF